MNRKIKLIVSVVLSCFMRVIVQVAIMDKYENMEIEVIKFDAEDVITTSGNEGEGDDNF